MALFANYQNHFNNLGTYTGTNQVSRIAALERTDQDRSRREAYHRWPPQRHDKLLRYSSEKLPTCYAIDQKNAGGQ